jgi:hypothetical protein
MANAAPPTMPNGDILKPSEAAKYINAFRTYQETNDQSYDEDKLGVAQKFDLIKLRNFINAIDNDPRAKEINAVRIYLARSTRQNKIDENYDVVLIPVLDNNDDLHLLVNPDANIAKLTTILGEGSPCPNVCGNKALFL